MTPTGDGRHHAHRPDARRHGDPAERDRIVRAKERGTVVVQGGPRTGKTAVTPHRVVYLYSRQRPAAGGGSVTEVHRQVTAT